MSSILEKQFTFLWKIQCKDIQLISEHHFAKEIKRRWSFDFAHLDTKIAIEIEGGIWINGRHNNGKGFRNDCEKYNTAIIMGWKVFRLTSDMIKNPDLIDEIGVFIRNEISRL